MKKLYPAFAFICIFFLAGNPVLATRYYVATEGNNANNGLSSSTAWQSIGKVNSMMNSFLPGDSIFFKRGQTFTGKLIITKSGVSGNNLCFGSTASFGTGDYPLLTNSSGSIISLTGIQYIRLDGIKVTDLTLSPTDRTIEANIDHAITLNASQYNILTNLDFSLVGIGIELTNGSTFNSISYSRFSNGRMVRNTPTTINANDDFGANGIVISSNDNTVSNCSFDGEWASSYDYGVDGGCIEIFGGYSRNKALYNTAINCNGFMEFGSGNGGTASDNLVAYNLIINCGLVTWLSLTGDFAVAVNNLQYNNNNIIETSNQFSQNCLFDYNGSPLNQNILSLKNNIFCLSNGIDVVKQGKFSGGLLTRNNNIYKLSNGSAVNFTLNASELSTAAILFNNTTSTDPSQWNYRLYPTSPAIDFGVDVGLTQDFFGTPLSSTIGKPDAGIVETNTASVLLQNSSTSTSSTTSIIACSSYFWNGSTYSSPGTFTFTAKNKFGQDSIATLILTLAGTDAPGIPASITGPLNACPYIGTGATVTYTAPPVSNALKYRWTLPSTVSIVSAPTDSSSITITFAANFPTGTNKTIKVKSIGCTATSSDKSLLISVSAPATPGVISGITNACLFIGSEVKDTFRISKVTNATRYIWTVPTGATITAHPGRIGTANDTSIVVSFSNSFISGSKILVQAASPCDTSKERALTILRTIPVTPGVITGPTDVCPYVVTTANPTGTEATYTIRKIANVVSYTWAVPVGATITARPGGAGTVNDTIIKVRFGSSFVKDTMKVYAYNGCGASAKRVLIVSRILPATPGTITGNTNACLYIGSVNRDTFRINKIANSSFYTWIVPTGVTITARPGGAGTPNDTCIVVAFSNDFVSGTKISVEASTNCGSSAASSITIVRTVPSTPGIITGPTDACALMVSSTNPTGTEAAYTIRKVLNATSYNWAVPAGVTIIARPGIAGTITDTIIKVKFDAGFVKDSIKVAAINGCGTSTNRILVVSRVLPATPGVISGPTDVCPNIFSATSAVYSIRKVTDATAYIWTMGGNANIASHTSGPNDTSISITFDPTFTNGSLSVTSVRPCGNSLLSRTLLIVKRVPDTPVITGNIKPCILTTSVYTATAPTASSYIWTVPAGTSISGNTSGASISVNFSATFTGGNITAKAVSICGTSIAASFSLTTCTSIPRSQTTKVNHPAKDKKATINVYPNPSDGNFIITVDLDRKNNPVFPIEIENEFGILVYHSIEIAGSSINSSRVNKKLVPGIYIIKTVLNGETITKKLVVTR